MKTNTFLNLFQIDKLKSCHFHSAKPFLDDLGTLNDWSVFNYLYKEIYPSELQLADEHASTHETFLNLDITANHGVFVYKLFHKLLLLLVVLFYTKNLIEKLWNCLIE